MRIGAEKLMRAVQPYVAGNNPLWHIHESDRIDKHRLLITAGTSFGHWGVPVGGGQSLQFKQWTKIPLAPNYEIVNIPTSTYNRQAHEDFHLGIDISFGKSEIVAGKPVLETLNNMADFVDTFVGQFEPFLV